MKLYCYKSNYCLEGFYSPSCLLITALLFIHINIYAQDRCGTDLIFSNNNYVPLHLTDYVSGRSSQFEIPIVFHIFTLSGEDPLSELSIHEQIDILNTNYGQVNAPLSLYDEASALAADPNIRFYLADIDPDGHETNGIIHYETDDAALGNIDQQSGSRKVKYTSMGGSDAWDTDLYLNIWATPRNDGRLGDSSFPKSGQKEEDGVVVNNLFVGFQSLNVKFGSGKTLVHEIGHYLGLRHPFGGDTCMDNDNVEDTPIQASAYFGCPSYPQESCGSLDLIYNYMDFHDDQCLRFFTKGQVDLMHHILNTCRAELTNQSPPISNNNENLDDIVSYHSNNHIIIHDNSFESLDLELTLFDIRGRLLHQSSGDTEIVHRINSTGWNTGLYLLVLERNEKYETRKIFIAH